MAEFNRFSTPRLPKGQMRLARKSSTGIVFIDYKNVDELRRLMTPNGKIQSRKRTQMDAAEQRIASAAIKRARFMALLPYTSATL